MTKIETTNQTNFKTLEQVSFWKNWKNDKLTEKILKVIIGIVLIPAAIIKDLIIMGTDYLSKKTIEPKGKMQNLKEKAQKITKVLLVSLGYLTIGGIIFAGGVAVGEMSFPERLSQIKYSVVHHKYPWPFNF